jgi:predicted CXXCH cytochrome family protein
MKLSGNIILALAVVLCAALSAGAATIENTKHDLSAGSTGAAIKSQSPVSGGTTEICVFCHTPHTASADAPLWNRANPVGSYTTYTSDVLNALNYPVEDPLSAGAAGYQVHVKTRICMSCHDGTIALGSLVNLPTGNTMPIAMQGTSGGRMPMTAAGYLGTDLRDDHPVAVVHDPTRDPELQSITGSKARVYTLAAGRVTPTTINGGYIECTSCHDAHDNQYGKFLIDDNTGSKICISCHNKAGDDSPLANESVHSNPTINTPYAPGTPPLGTTVQNVKCMDCHYPHKAGVQNAGWPNYAPNPGAGKYNLAFQEEQTCYTTTNRWGQATSVCHGAGSSSKDIQGQVTKTSAHHVAGYGATIGTPHNATEGRGGTPGWLSAGGNSWHVECDDCHNSHTAGGLLHLKGTNAVTSTSAVYGAGGVEPSWPAGWSVPTSFTYLEPYGLVTIGSTGVSKEYQICLKCHSYFAWSTAGPSSVPTLNLTDQAKEFNPSNGSFHPVAGANANNQGTLINGWNNGVQTMYCSDCHGNNSGIPTDPQGPHGSTASPGYILIADYQDSYLPKGSVVSLNDICFKCHDESVYQSGADTLTGTGFSTSGGTNLHTRHRNLSGTSALSNTGYACVNCHTRIPHGYLRKALIITAGDIDASAYQAAGGAKITSLVGGFLPSSQNYGVNRGDSCNTVGGCHQ